MRPQLADAIIQARHIFHQNAHLILDKARLFAHFNVAHNGAHGVERQRHGVGRNRIDAHGAAFIHQIGQAAVQFGKHTF